MWLHDVDPTAAPLPIGTQVATRVDRVIGERVVPQGTVGRVVAVHADGVDVKLVGRGVARFARHEIAPQKIGQLRFAVRREAAWQALRPCAVLEAVVGSHAWGLDEPGSDVDRRGAFVLPFGWTIALGRPPEDLVSLDGSETYWEVGKLVRQALRADPNTLELLFLADTTALDPIGRWLLDARDRFVSAEIYGSFGRYSLSQLKKLTQSSRLFDHRRLVLEWLRAEPSLAQDELAERLAASAGLTAEASARDARLHAKRWVQQLYRSLYDQGLLERRDYRALVELARAGATESEIVDDLPRELRPKNAYNLLRLLACATEWLASGRPTLRVAEGPLRVELLAIKHGEVPLEEVLRRAEAMIPALEAARSSTPLPRRADVATADALLRRIREEVGRRHFAKEPGALGCDAPALPLLEEEEEQDA